MDKNKFPIIKALNPGNLMTYNLKKACGGVSDVLVDDTVQYADVTDKMITVTVKEVQASSIQIDTATVIRLFSKASNSINGVTIVS
jgi:hypothetical protein